ncbi:uncharacterized protein LOC143606961 [Bidens hawaiensis]|uniref:uncharacterized protein LOC143606961 n=1 Tax=Bidens hawaiensis TaxID=980011 RepID=UPI00404B565D
MRKLYHTKGKIHPSPPPPSPSSTTTSDHHLSLLPFAIATLAATLPPQDQQVLAYLLSISATTTTNNNNKYPTGKVTTKSGSSGDHAPQFKCNCFRCYTSFWVRWDASPNRKVIHEILDAYEDGLTRNNNKKNGKNKKERKNNNNNNNNNININNSKGFSSSLALASATSTTTSIDIHAPPCTVENTSQELVDIEQRKMDGGDEKSGSVRKIVSFIGERIWGVWGV